MNWNIKKILKKIDKDKDKLLGGNWGFEVEYLRTDKEGKLAMTPHPKEFGEKLENTKITVDYSESQLELITSPHNSIEDAYKELQNIYSRASKNIDDEYLWPLSMPCALPSEEDIPIAKYKNTKLGKESEIYRRGLGLRYSKTMQMISGVHYNFSFSDDLLITLHNRLNSTKDFVDFKNNIYENTVRNFLKYRWLLVYLFGASTNYHNSFARCIENQIEQIKTKCKQCECIDRHLDYATSIRVSRFGYSSTIQDKLDISFNSLQDYIDGCKWAITNSYKKYTNLGIFENEKQIQLNDNYLQKPSEYYSPIRYKRHSLKNESTLDALQKRGIEYLETRLIDKDPFIKEGVTKDQLYFIHIFLIFCMLKRSDYLDSSTLDFINKNHHLVSLLGRKPNLMLYTESNKSKSLVNLGENIFSSLEEISSFIGNRDYINTINKQKKKLYNKELLPSYKLAKSLNKAGGFLEFGIDTAKKHKGE